MTPVSNNIKEYLISLYGERDAELYFEYIRQEPAQYIRINHLQGTEDKLLPKLEVYGIKTRKVDILPYAHRVLEGMSESGKTLEFNLGKYYLQSLSSMIPPMVLNPDEKDIVLDLCAAPGSKSTQIAEMMNNEGKLFSNESNPDRVKMLVHNLDKLNIVNTGVILHKGEGLSSYYNNYFDKILVDAPCSALGVIQKKNEVSRWWSTERVSRLTSVQIALITAAIKMVKVGGEIVYSTCTMTSEENELIIHHVLNKYPLEVLAFDIPLKYREAFTSYKGEHLNHALSKAKRILPWENDSEGFFIIKIRKTGEVKISQQFEHKKNNLKLLSFKNKEIHNHLITLSNQYGIPEDEWEKYSFVIKSNDVFFCSNAWQGYYPGILTRLGTHFATIDRNNRILLHSDAAQVLQGKISSNVFGIEDKESLKSYLAGGTIRTETIYNQQQVIKYQDYTLGTAVPVSNGLKSQYPKSKRMQEITII